MKKRVPHILAAAFVALMAWWALFDEAGNFDVPRTLDLASYRIGEGFRRIVSTSEAEIRETNAEMQETTDGRRRLNERRLARDRDNP